jgi:hypothetical protein
MNMSHFETSDFPLGITLITLGFPLDYISKSTDRMGFQFRRENGLDEAVQAFWRDELRVEPKLFYLNQKLLKSRILSNN